MRRDGNNAKNENEPSDPLHPSHSSHPSPEPERLLPPRGDYHTLHAFHKAEVVYAPDYLIDRQLLRLEKDFLEQGGLRERMTRLRLEYRRTHPGP